MDVRCLKYFIATAEERSIRRAAERLHVTQPPPTRLIHSMEEEPGALASAMPDTIPRRLRAFSSACPDMSKERQIDALRQGRILAAFDRYLPGLPDIRAERSAGEAGGRRFRISLPGGFRSWAVGGEREWKTVLEMS
jgi:DNA-binding transcriptional LysR family regulator